MLNGEEPDRELNVTWALVVSGHGCVVVSRENRAVKVVVQLKSGRRKASNSSLVLTFYHHHHLSLFH